MDAFLQGSPQDLQYVRTVLMEVSVSPYSVSDPEKSLFKESSHKGVCFGLVTRPVINMIHLIVDEEGHS